MSVDLQIVSEKVFTLLKGFGLAVESFNSAGETVIDPRQAVRFAVTEPNIVVRLDPSESAIVLATGPGEQSEKLRKMLRALATDSMLNFDYRQFNKTITPKSERIDISRKQAVQDDQTVIESEYTMTRKEMEEMRKLAGMQPMTEGRTMRDEAERMSREEFVAEHPGDGEFWDSINDEIDGLNQHVFSLGKCVWCGKHWDSINDENYGDEEVSESESDYGPDKEWDAPGGKRLAKRRTPPKKMSPVKRNKRPKVGATPRKHEDGATPRKHEDGTTTWWLNGKLHRVDGPAIELVNGEKHWYLNGLRHREDGPAREYANGDKFWYINGQLHRGNGPAIEWASGDEHWYLKGERVAMSDVLGKKKPKEGVEMREGFGSMSGSKKTSRQQLENVKIVVKHKNAVNEESRGSRSRNIHSIFIQRGDERFKLPENNLSAARAMARHLNSGGEVFDQVGTNINEMATEFRKLKEFVRYVNSAKLINEANAKFVEIAKESISTIKSSFKQLASSKGYMSACEHIENYKTPEILEDDIDLESQFTETHFDDKVANVVDSLRGGMAKRAAFESKIDEAIKAESFTDLSGVLSEDDGYSFTDSRSQLGHQISQLGAQASDESLRSYLMSISNKVSEGGSLGQHEYSTVKSCLMTATSNISPPDAPMNESLDKKISDEYAKLISTYDIF